MNKLFSKMTDKLESFKYTKRGFSLVELIVVIAIMAVIAVVLIPSLLRNVEESRAEKDVKSTDELVSAVELSLSDQDVYDELVEHSVLDNIACYIDKDSESEYTDNKTILKDGDVPQYTFDNDTRRLDESLYFGAGNMRGLTITFSPIKSSNKTEYVLKDGIINKFVARNIGYLGENQNLYNGIRQIVGDKLKLSSQTYRNSDFTVFIRMGTIGGNQASAQDAIQVWGQFNGTNLSSDIVNLYKLTNDRTVGEAGLDDIKINLGNQDDKLNFNVYYELPCVYNEANNKYEIETWFYTGNHFDINKALNADEYIEFSCNQTSAKQAVIPIKLKPNTKYTMTAKRNPSFLNNLCVYRSDKSYYSFLNQNSRHITTLDDGMLYVGFYTTSASSIEKKIQSQIKNFTDNIYSEIRINEGSKSLPYQDFAELRTQLTSPVEITENDELVKRNGLYGWKIVDETTSNELAFYPLPDDEQSLLYNFEKSISLD